MATHKLSNQERYKIRSKKMKNQGKVPMFFYIPKTHREALGKRVGFRKVGYAIQALIHQALYVDTQILRRLEPKITEISAQSKKTSTPTQEKAA